MVSKALPLIIDWYEHHARDLPWRGDEVSPWGVLVSEVMLQQTPVSRVLPIYQQWMSRWPTPSALAGSSPGEAVRVWGRLGYPRRALRLHAAAVACAQEHDGQVPSSIRQLRALPGIGEYTAAAVASFAFQQRHAVLDTNVRRVHARLLDGRQFEESGTTTVGERRRALALLPQDPALAARASIAVMELGALICKARAPNCDSCPAVKCCTWNLVGRPLWDGAKRCGQTYAGTDRQCRGHLLEIVRNANDATTTADLIESWSDQEQSQRAMTSLIADGLLEASASATTDGRPIVRLPR